MKKLGLLGRNINYSFSRNYFNQKFEKEALIHYSYQNFDIQSIEEFSEILIQNPDLIGLNVTIPYKETIIKYLDELSEIATEIGAVNTIKISESGRKIGHNTDFYGFQETIKPLLKPHHKKALILGTGGAAKAIVFALKKLNIETQLVSRNEKNTIKYTDLNLNIFQEYQIVINCTPVGTFPETEQYPNIPYHFFNSKHIAFDLIYNPEKTTFLKKAEENNAVIQNGYQMLVLQAEKAWQIWNDL
jgi:shikimate dehydrogenase